MPADLIPIIPDHALLGLLGAPFARNAWHYYRRPGFWADVVHVKRCERYREHNGKWGGSIDDYYDDGWRTREWTEAWVVVRRKVYHRFPREALIFDRLCKNSDPKDKYIGVGRVESDTPVEKIVEYTAEAKRLARIYCKLEGEPDSIERAKRLCES